MQFGGHITKKTLFVIRGIPPVEGGGDSPGERIEESDNRINGELTVTETSVDESIEAVVDGKGRGIENTYHRFAFRGNIPRPQYQ